MNRVVSTFTLVLLCPLILFSQGTLSTVAGGGTFEFTDDEGPAVEAQLGRIGAVAADREGGVYAYDSGRIRLIHVTADGILQTINPDDILDSITANSSVGADGSIFALTTNGDGSLYAGVLPAPFAFRNPVPTPPRFARIDTSGDVTYLPGPRIGFATPQGFAVDGQGNLYVTNTRRQVVLR